MVGAHVHQKDVFVALHAQIGINKKRPFIIGNTINGAGALHRGGGDWDAFSYMVCPWGAGWCDYHT